MMKENQEIPLLALSHLLWQKGELSYKLDSLQSTIHNTVLDAYPRARQICVLSSRQIGKSYWALIFALCYLIKNSGCIVRLLAPTKAKAYELIEDNLLPIMADCPADFIKKQKTQLRWNIIHNNSSLRIGPLEGAHVDSNRSGNAKLVIYEECGFVTSDEFNYARRSVIGPQLLRSNGHEIFVTSPSKDPQHALHNEILPECDLLGTLFRYTVYDSPSLTANQIEEAARRSGGEESEDFRREYLAQIIRSASLMVVPKLDEAITFGVFEFDPEYREFMMITGDWGGVKDKTVFLLHYYDPFNDHTYVLDELVFNSNTVTTKILSALRPWYSQYPTEVIWADLPGQIYVDANDLLRAHQISFAIPPKGDWVGAVNTLAAKFALNKMRINKKKCPFLYKSIMGGTFNKARTDFERSTALGHCDALAALMYAMRVQALDENASRFHDGREKIVSQEARAALQTPAFGRFKDGQNSNTQSLRNFSLSKYPGRRPTKGLS